ncbi:MAG: hypothetical protein M3Y09_19330 [Actinomycetota bacterium]|nr:hypothetical protein [Actinomycetota bacterium]
MTQDAIARRPALTGLLTAFATAIALTGCGGSSAATSAATSAPASSSPPPSTRSAAASSTPSNTSAVNPNQRETLPPGDIPDTIAYVPFTARTLGLTVSIPEGWSRSMSGRAVTFTDKLNRVRVFTAPASRTPTPASVRSAELPAIARSVKSFAVQSLTTISRPAGPTVRVAYLGDSTPNPITGKVGTLAFERYDFFHRGREVVILVSSPQGSDNVDPWRKVTSSLRFTR